MPATFSDKYQLTTASPHGPSSNAAFVLKRESPPEVGDLKRHAGAGAPQPEFQAGVYNSGELTLVDDSFSVEWREDWPEDIRPHKEDVLIAVNAFGEPFFWMPSVPAVYLLDVQGGRRIPIAGSVRDFLHVSLLREDVIRDLIRPEYVSKIAQRKGKLPYGSCYILVPMAMLGGVDRPNKYDVGRTDVYLSLVGQTLRQL